MPTNRKASISLPKRYRRLQLYIEAALYISQNVKGGPVGKIDFVKLLNDIFFNNYMKLELSIPPPPNLHKFGIYPIDVERAIYDDPEIIVHERTFEIKPSFDYRQLKEELGSHLHVIESEIEKAVKLRGHSIKSLILWGIDEFSNMSLYKKLGDI